MNSRWRKIAATSLTAVPVATLLCMALSSMRSDDWAESIWFVFAIGFALVLMALPWLAANRWLRRQKFAERGQCPECGYDLRASESRCPECGTPFRRQSAEDEERHVPLRDDWPASPVDPRQPSPSEQLVLVYRSANGMEADLLRQQMLARGVMCECRNTPLPMGELGAALVAPVSNELFVWSDDESRAREIIGRLIPAVPDDPAVASPRSLVQERRRPDRWRVIPVPRPRVGAARYGRDSDRQA